MSKGVSMRDIAGELGISAVSVSKALSGQSGVSSAMREKIIQTAKNMGYRYDLVAKRPVTHDIGIMIPNRFGADVSSFYAVFCQHVIKRLTSAKCYGVVEILREKDELRDLLPAMVTAGRVEALIVLGQVSREYMMMLEMKCPVPFICLDFYDERATADAVTSDSLYGAYRLTSHLIHGGHTRIAYFGTIKATSSIMDRYLGYYRSMLMHDLPIEPEWLMPDRDEHGEYIPVALPDPMPTAIVCNCDQSAMVLIRHLEELGLQVPGDVSVVGFDDYSEASVSAGLTTYAVDLDGMASQAVERILARLGGSDEPFGRIVVSGRLVYRDSVRKLTND